MNHLAHLLLAGADPDHRLGALLGDHIKGRAVLDDMRPGLARGIRLHRRIDAWSDSHPAVLDLLARLDSPWRRYGGIMLDVLFDRELVLRWDRYCDVGLAEFARRTDALLARHAPELPARMNRFAAWAASVNLWQRLGEREMLDDIFARIAARHGRIQPLARGTELLDQLGPAIGEAFEELFPDLQARAAEFLAKN